jgi:hypothetical protein
LRGNMIRLRRRKKKFEGKWKGTHFYYIFNESSYHCHIQLALLCCLLVLLGYFFYAVFVDPSKVRTNKQTKRKGLVVEGGGMHLKTECLKISFSWWWWWGNDRLLPIIWSILWLYSWWLVVWSSSTDRACILKRSCMLQSKCFEQ